MGQHSSIQYSMESIRKEEIEEEGCGQSVYTKLGWLKLKPPLSHISGTEAKLAHSTLHHMSWPSAGSSSASHTSFNSWHTVIALFLSAKVSLQHTHSSHVDGLVVVGLKCLHEGHASTIMEDGQHCRQVRSGGSSLQHVLQPFQSHGHNLAVRSVQELAERRNRANLQIESKIK